MAVNTKKIKYLKNDYFGKRIKKDLKKKFKKKKKQRR